MFYRPSRYRRLARRLAVPMLLLAVGCFDMRADIHMDQDGSGTATLGYSLSESILRSGPLDNMLSRRKGGGPGLDADKIAKKIGDREGIKLNDVDVWMEDDQHFVRLHMDFEDISYLGDDDVRYEWELEGGYWVFRVIVSKERTRKQEYTPVQKAVISAMDQQGFHFKIHLPRRIVESNADTVNWNVAEFFVPLGFFLMPDASTKVLYAKTEATTWERVKSWFADLIPE